MPRGSHIFLTHTDDASLFLLNKNGNLNKIMDSSTWDDADIHLWVERSVAYLIEYELIDKQISYDFANRLIISVSGKSIYTIYEDDEKSAYSEHITKVIGNNDFPAVHNKLNIVNVEQKEIKRQAYYKCVGGDTLIDFFTNNGFEIVDKRPKGGCLWVVGEQNKLGPYIELARSKFGASCKGDFAIGSAIQHRMGWWTKCPK